MPQIELMAMSHNAEQYVSMRQWTEKGIWTQDESPQSTAHWLCDFMQITNSLKSPRNCRENVMRINVELYLLVC